ncbi:MAG TPA: hypothetical protein VIJ28_16415 [Chloroflexota bacterium]
MDGQPYQQHLQLLLGRVRDALASARSQDGPDPSVQAGRVAGLLRMQASLERKLADHTAAEEQIELDVVMGPAPGIACPDDGQSLEEKRRQYQVLDGEISQTRGRLPQMRADLTVAAFHALAEPSEIKRKQCEVDALVDKIARWSARRDCLARQLSQQEP